jgi:hypothetical protein
LRACFIFIAAIVGILAAPAALAANLFDAGAGLALSPEIRNGLLGLAILVGWIALAMLLPDFDGREDSDWGDSEESYRRPY